MALLNRSGSDTSAMRAVARQRENLTHDVKVGDHMITVDEPEEQGGDDLGPSPQLKRAIDNALGHCWDNTPPQLHERLLLHTLDSDSHALSAILDELDTPIGPVRAAVTARLRIAS